MVFAIKAGPPARLGEIAIHDDSGFSPVRLLKASGWRRNTHLTAARAERGLNRLHQYYVAHGRLQVNVSIEQRLYNAKTNTETLVVKAAGGPLIRVKVQGAAISSSELRTLLPIYHDGVTDDQALAASEKLLADHFQQKGFFFATVKASRTTREQPPASAQPSLLRGAWTAWGICRLRRKRQPCVFDRSADMRPYHRQPRDCCFLTLQNSARTFRTRRPQRCWRFINRRVIWTPA